MKIPVEKSIKLIEDYYSEYLNPIYGYTWSKENNVPTGLTACKFFIEVMLDQIMNTDRSIEGAYELTYKLKDRYAPNQRKYFEEIWIRLAALHIDTNENTFNNLKEFCTFDEGGDFTGYYAGLNCNVFPYRLVHNAKIIRDKYDGAVENIWGGGKDLAIEEFMPNPVFSNIEQRFMEFEGIGENLAHMAVFSLVRDHGLCRKKGIKKYLRIKVDTHVKTVLNRCILDFHTELGSLNNFVKELNENLLESPADFDLALYEIGRNFCFCKNPLCKFCPIRDVCNTYQNKPAK